MQHTFTLHKNSIRISATHGGKQYRVSTGLQIASPSLWDSKAKSLKARCKDRRILPDLLTIHSRLTEKEATARTEADVRAALDYALEREKPVTPSSPVPSFWEFFKEWSERPSPSIRQRRLAYNTVKRLMGTAENWDGVDTAYWFRFQSLLEGEGKPANYRASLGSKLRVVMHEGYMLKYHRNNDFREFKQHREPVDSIALSPAEIELLWAFEPKTRAASRVRDLALIGYYSASRYSDYSRLTLGNIHEGRLEFVQQKTGDRVAIPASPRLVELLERNGGCAPQMCQQVFNRDIKKVAKDAGIEGWFETKGEKIERYKAVSSHTFRRSAITTLYKSGMSAKDCMYISGHKSMQAFEVYVKVGREDAYTRMVKSKFFK